MSTKRITFCLLMVCLLAMQAARARAQDYQPFGPVGVDHDFQLFAPAITEDYGDIRVPPKTGWFFEYRRVMLNMSRPDFSPIADDDLFFGPPVDNLNPFLLLPPPAALLPPVNTSVLPFEGDNAWGNRFNIGYMTEEDHGWTVTVWNIQGPSEYFIEDHVRQLPDMFGGETIEDQVGLDTLLDPIGDEPISINVAKLTGVELNKVFRLKQLHRGLILEPFIGARYVIFTDFNENTVISLPDSVAGADGAVVLSPFIYRNRKARRENNMIGGQLGLRTNARRGHWVLTTESKAFALHNFQFFRSVTREERQDVFAAIDDEGEEGDVLSVLTFDRTIDGFREDELVLGVELSVEATFEITRQIALSVGFEYMNFTMGIGRGVLQQQSDQNLQLAGVIFGFNWNR